MPWILEHNGQKIAVQDGRTYTTIDSSQDFGGNFIIKETKYHQDGYKEVRKTIERAPMPIQALHEKNLNNPSLDDLLGHEKKLLKSKGLKVKKTRYRSGLRVEFLCPNTRDVHMGTVVTPNKEHILPTESFLICADFKKDYFRDLNFYTGTNYGVVVHGTGSIRVLPDQSSPQAFSGVPDHVGVMVHTPFIWDGVRFRRGSIGRLLHFDGDQATVSWFSMRDDNFYQQSGISTPGGFPARVTDYPHCYGVPAASLQWCYWNTNHEIVKVWAGLVRPQVDPKFKAGDYVVYVNPKPARISGERNYAVVKGAILRIKSRDTRGSLCVASLVNSGGLSPSDQETAQLEVRLDPSHLALLEFPYIEAGNKVEITAALEFKKEKLQGARGLVILPTDADGHRSDIRRLPGLPRD